MIRTHQALIRGLVEIERAQSINQTAVNENNDGEDRERLGMTPSAMSESGSWLVSYRPIMLMGI